MNSSNLNKQNLLNLRYGLQAQIYKKSSIHSVTIYIDTCYDNFLWISTHENSFLVDLYFTNISFYSLQLQLDLKQNQKFKNYQNKKYIILKQLNNQIPIIFNQVLLFNIQNSMNSFFSSKKPSIFDQFNSYIQQQKSRCVYSTNFSRLFKKFRMELEMVRSQIQNKFKYTQVLAALKSVEEIKSFSFQEFLNKEHKYFTTSELLEILKKIYCRLNTSFLKSIMTNQNTTNKKQKIQSKPIINCFQQLMIRQNASTHYILPEHTVNQNLPLTDYFCFSSHNTYLTGNQLTSDAKVKRYIEDLRKGIKCVQLDVHNKGDNQPIITHALKGKGLVKPIGFRQTIQAIDQYLEYHPLHFPVILSIQNHASQQNQQLMNNILRKQFPKNILIPNQSDQFYKLSEIKGKIIVKTSSNIQNLIQFKNNHQIPKIKSYNIQSINNLMNNNSSLNTSHNFSSSQLHENHQTQNTSQDFIQGQRDQCRDYKLFLQNIQKFKNLKVKFNQKIDQNSYLPVQKIVQITCMFKAQKGINSQKPHPYQSTSLENTKIIKLPRQKFIQYTKKSWIRSYPEGTQINSKNYDFLQLLARGIQIIALNTQTNDDYALMLNSYFRAGRTTKMQNLGYIQKPLHLRKGQNSKFNQEQRNYIFLFYTHHKLEFKLYNLDKQQVNYIPGGLDEMKRIEFKIKQYNESFLVIKISDKKWIQSIPLRFLPQNKNQKIYRTLIGRDYQFQDTGIRILCSFLMV